MNTQENSTPLSGKTSEPVVVSTPANGAPLHDQEVLASDDEPAFAEDIDKDTNPGEIEQGDIEQGEVERPSEPVPATDPVTPPEQAA